MPFDVRIEDEETPYPVQLALAQNWSIGAQRYVRLRFPEAVKVDSDKRTPKPTENDDPLIPPSPPKSTTQPDGPVDQDENGSFRWKGTLYSFTNGEGRFYRLLVASWPLFRCRTKGSIQEVNERYEDAGGSVLQQRVMKTTPETYPLRFSLGSPGFPHVWLSVVQLSTGRICQPKPPNKPRIMGRITAFSGMWLR